MKVLVTGAAGFIGSNLVHQLPLYGDGMNVRSWLYDKHYFGAGYCAGSEQQVIAA